MIGELHGKALLPDQEAGPLALMEALIVATEAQLDAARRIDGEQLDCCNRQRADLLFELQVRLQEPLAAEVLALLKERAQVLAVLEDRLERVAFAVLGTIGAMSADQKGKGTYGREGRLQAG